MPTRKIWDHTIEMKEGFVPRKRKAYLLSRKERRGVGVHTGTIEERVHPTLKVASNGTGVLCREERWEKENGARLSISQ